MDNLNCENPKDHEKAGNIDRVAIFGFADAPVNSNLYKDAFNVAKILAQTGYLVVNGGGPGVMRAATEGAHAVGGKVTGVTFYPKEIIRYEGKDPQNQVDEEVITQNYVERTLRLLERGQVYVVLNGGTGTISEFGMAWGLARLYFGHHKPLILYGNFWHEIIEAFKKNMHLREGDLSVFKIVNSPHEVLVAITEFGREIKEGKHIHLRVDNDEEQAFTL
ncbi:LOG family protein [Candidatus Microgenomates bacterium]|nr:LOG family protein [Candidatus Microgenomates bacterium]